MYKEGWGAMRDVKAEERENGRLRRIGEFLAQLDEGGSPSGLKRGMIMDFRVRLRSEEEPSVLLIVRAEDGSGKHIAFVGAFSVADVLLAWRAREGAAGLKWREDVPWSQKAG